MKDDSVHVKHILDSIAKIEEYTQGLDFDKFCESNIAQSSVIRELGDLPKLKSVLKK